MPVLRTTQLTASVRPLVAVPSGVTDATVRSAYGIRMMSTLPGAAATLLSSRPFSKTSACASART